MYGLLRCRDDLGMIAVIAVCSFGMCWNFFPALVHDVSVNVNPILNVSRERAVQMKCSNVNVKCD